MQFQGTIILEYLDRRSRAESDLRRLKESLISSGEWDPQKLMPEAFGEEESEELPETDALDLREVEWQMPSSAEEEYKALMAELGQASQGVITGEDVILPPPRPESGGNGDGGWM